LTALIAANSLTFSSASRVLAADVPTVDSVIADSWAALCAELPKQEDAELSQQEIDAVHGLIHLGELDGNAVITSEKINQRCAVLQDS
jgi:hypothetical protein